MARAVTVSIALCLIYFLYIIYIAWVIPDFLALLVNFILVPLTIGVLTFRQLRRAPLPLLWLLLMAALIPLPTVLYSGGDPAKPWLHWELYCAVVFVFAIGEGLGYVATWVLNRKKASDAKA
jgi:hypothetical protein